MWIKYIIRVGRWLLNWHMTMSPAKHCDGRWLCCSWIWGSVPETTSCSSGGCVFRTLVYFHSAPTVKEATVSTPQLQDRSFNTLVFFSFVFFLFTIFIRCKVQYTFEGSSTLVKGSKCLSKEQSQTVAYWVLSEPHRTIYHSQK